MTLSAESVHEERRESPERRVLIVEDHGLLAQSLALTLRTEGFTVETILVPDRDEVLDVIRANRPDVILLDLDLGDAGSGVSFIEPIIEQGARVVILTGVTDRIRLAECIEAGAVGLVSKTASFEALVGAVREAIEAENLLSPAQRHEWLTELRRYRTAERGRKQVFEELTDREREVLEALTEGLTAAEIAERFHVSISTVRSHIRSVLMKLGVNSQLEAVVLANRLGWSN